MENMTSKELKAMAKELKVKNWWTLKKAELIAEITAAQTVEEEVVEDEAESTQVETSEAVEESIVEESTEVPETTQKPSNKKQDLIEYNGKVQNLSAWAKELGMPGQTLYARLRISNWPVERAFTTPTRRKKNDEE